MKPLLLIILVILLGYSSAVLAMEIPTIAGLDKTLLDEGKDYSLYLFSRDKSPMRAWVLALRHGGSKKMSIAAYPSPQFLADVIKQYQPLAIINGGFYSIEKEKYLALGEARGKEQRCPSRKRGWPVLYKQEKRFFVTSSPAKIVTNKKIVEVLQSRPRLLYNGKISSRTKNSAVTRRVNQPRTGIAFNKNTLFLLVVEGRSERSEGINLLEFAQFMKNLGAKEGLNLDGGGSSFFWFKGKLLNIPSGGWTPFTLPGMVRPIFNCLIVE